MARSVITFTLAFVVLVAGAFGPVLQPNRALAEADPDVLARVIPAAVQLAIVGVATENGVTEERYVPVASGTIVSPTGLILTNAHAIDFAAHQATLLEWERDAAERGEVFAFTINAEYVLILTSNGLAPAQPRYTATVAARDEGLDLAVLQITADAAGGSLDPAALALPWVPLGDSDTLRLAEPLDILGYPIAAGEAVTYTAGVVSGFAFDAGSNRRAWINTDATLSGGSSGGTAVNRQGELVGVPTQGSELDCRPGDTNGDGSLTPNDLGCIPVGGSFGQLRPVNLARQLLANVGYPNYVGAEKPTDGIACEGIRLLGSDDCVTIVGE